MSSAVPSDVSRRQTAYLLLCGVLSLLTGTLLVYSQTAAFAWDEGFHLLAAQLIKAGKTPYLDFFFAQTPLNAYWNAAWMSVFGESWRTAHAVAALLSAGAVALIADFVFMRWPVPEWRLAAAITTTLMLGLNSMIVEFGTVGQAYGLCLVLIAGAYRSSILSVERSSLFWPTLAGFLAGAAAMSSLLTAPVGPVLVIWMVIVNRTGNRWTKSAAFIAGVMIPSTPLLWLLWKSPRQVLFGIVNYHVYYRHVQWAGATRHDFEVLMSWIDSGQALLLGVLATGGLLFIIFRSDWNSARRAEFYLCGSLSLTLAAYLSTAHPTFERYFLFAVPFLSILAPAGLFAIASGVYRADRPWLPALILAILVSSGLGKALYERRDDFSWRDAESIARQVDRVTPSQASLLANEIVYFLTRRAPPAGMEFAPSHKIQMAPDLALFMHIVPETELKRRVKAGVFNTVEICEDEDQIKEFDLIGLYAQKADVVDCAVFWDRRTAPH